MQRYRSSLEENFVLIKQMDYCVHHEDIIGGPEKGRLGRRMECLLHFTLWSSSLEGGQTVCSAAHVLETG